MRKGNLVDRAISDLLRNKNKKAIDEFLRMLCITYDRDLEIYRHSLATYQMTTGKTDWKLEQKIESIAKTLKMLAFLRRNIGLLLRSPL